MGGKTAGEPKRTKVERTGENWTKGRGKKGERNRRKRRRKLRKT
jgi:hypothetical protein